MVYLWTGKTVLVAFGCIALGIIATIIVMRYRLSIKNDTKPTSILADRTKYTFANIYKRRDSVLLFGFFCSLLIVFSAFNYTQFSSHFISTHCVFEEFEEMITIPRTPPPASKPPPPPPKEIKVEPVEEDIEVPDFIDESVEAYDDVTIEPKEIEEPVREAFIPVLPDPVEVVVDDEIYARVQEMPSFPGCKDLSSEADTKKCTESKMMSFIYKNLKYPNIAKENGVEGQVVVRFVIKKDGEIDNIELLRDIGAGCGDEAQKTVIKMKESLGKWIPGKQNGRAVNVSYTLPIRFRLEG